ncbi:MAG: DUF960 domain-containing protein [Clostridia bacterium]|jgi:hypothetical protein|nr:DUF960 domain-containing protein [Clostridia bacterium]MCI2000589.1 DUF960 domain-containing protein [Clostridia bacterium]MCI2015045.1 DUF960 domain-containing protein [Clostridia bacterium]
MFKNKRYVTRGASSIPFWIQMILWLMIDSLDIEKDWLQVFNITTQEEKIHIIHTQEQPPYKRESIVPLNGESEITAKIFVIDDGEHSTMLLAEEY